MVAVMRGATTLRNHIKYFMEQEIPLIVDVMRDQYELSEFELPYPAVYDAVDPTVLASDAYPGMGAVVINDGSWNREDWDMHAEQVYSPVFTVRFIVVARTPLDENEEWEEPEKASAIRVRDDLVAALHHAVLQTPSLGQPDSIKCNESNMTTDYLEPYLANSQSARWIAGALINVTISFTESTYEPPIGTANTVKLTVDHINDEE